MAFPIHCNRAIGRGDVIRVLTSTHPLTMILQTASHSLRHRNARLEIECARPVRAGELDFSLQPPKKISSQDPAAGTLAQADRCHCNPMF